MKKILCIIPARENSKRLIGKNNKIFFNKPLVFWTLRFASKLNYIAKIIFTSDSQKILDIAKPFKKISRKLRPKKLAKDKSKSEDALIHFAENILFDILVFIQQFNSFQIRFSNFLTGNFSIFNFVNEMFYITF